MGTSLVLRVEASDPAVAVRAAEDAIRAVEHVDALLSTWRPDAELAQLNRVPPGRAMVVSAELIDALRDARALTAATHRAFDPTVGALVDAWDLRGPGAVPDAAGLRAALRATGWEQFPMDPPAVRRADPTAWIDSGGFGKGAALHAARTALDAAGIGRALLNFGGQILVLGAPDAPWRVTVADPTARGESLLTLELVSGSVATSGQSERTHILDPRSGRPTPAWGGVTVVDPDPLRADALATALFVLGPALGWDWAQTHHVAALFVTRGAGEAVIIRPTSALPTRARVASGE